MFQTHNPERADYDLVSIDSCNRCHCDLTFHGGRYYQVENGVTCHNSKKVSNAADILPQMFPPLHLEDQCQLCHNPNMQADATVPIHR